MATLAGILVVVAYHMSEWRTFRTLLSSPRSDILVLLVTFLLTVFIDLTVAIEVGMVLAAFLFMKQMAEVTNVTMITRELADENGASDDESGGLLRRQVPPGVEVYEIDGPFFFGAAEAFRNALGQVARKPRVLIIRMRHVPAMDATGLHVLGALIDQARHDHARVILAEVHAQPMVVLTESGLMERVTNASLADSLDEALAMAGDGLS